jgi:hypothetical protein
MSQTSTRSFNISFFIYLMTRLAPILASNPFGVVPPYL